MITRSMKYSYTATISYTKKYQKSISKNNNDGNNKDDDDDDNNNNMMSRPLRDALVFNEHKISNILICIH